MQQQALSTLVAWMRLDSAISAFHLRLKQQHGITGLQLAVLHTLAERPHMALAALRKGLDMHAATLGQSIDELRRLELCIVRTDPRDRRARLVAITQKGLDLVAEVPLAGPNRLRQLETDPARLDRLTEALADALELFALAEKKS
ncbi:DNA-binding transcriptional regulator, MarR family [Devosia crocina]|uniref:DNA-binding transcriptional regulator, MarR family n=2 Tax=Devosia crocina TaxID=429728 RepID=A0A1I7NSV3_9HYPH|nr:DNA-binding transcriptional regulator, MarR family [Devosia crocina]